MYLFLPFIKINQAYLQIKRIGGSFQILMTVKKHYIKDHELKNQHSHIILWKENQIKRKQNETSSNSFSRNEWSWKNKHNQKISLRNIPRKNREDFSTVLQ